MELIVDALDVRVEQEGQEVEVKARGGSWADMRTLIAPFAELWASVGTLCNSLALDEDDILDGVVSERDLGKSSLAHEILRMMANAEHKAVSL